MAEKKEDNSILIGSKSVRVYEEAIKIQFEEKGSKEVVLKARGKNIVTAFNVLEFARRRDDSLVVKDITSASESFKDKEKDRDIFVSAIDIIITKK